MKKVIGTLMALIICLTCVASVGCTKDPKTLSISQASTRLTQYEQATLTVENASGEISWSNSNEQVAKLTADGKTATILAIKAGSATLTAKVGKQSVKCDLTVLPAEEEIKLSLLSASQMLMVVGEESSIKQSITFGERELDGATASYSIVSQSPHGCVQVAEDGKITALSKGTAIVKVQGEYYGNLTKETFISVISIPQSEAVLNKNAVTLFVGDARYPSTSAISAQIYTDGDTADATVVSSITSDESVAIFEDGMIKAKSIGTAEIILGVQRENGKIFESTVFVTVKDKPEISVYFNSPSISLNNKDYSITTGNVYKNTEKLSAAVSVEGEVIKNPQIIYGIKTGKNVASISSDGTVTGLQKGVAVVTGTYVDEYGAENVAECTVTVDAPVYYGAHANYAHDGLVAEFDKFTAAELQTIAIKDVSLTSDKNVELIKLQYIPDASAIGNSDGIGPRQLQIVVQDASDLDNYFWISIIRTTATSTRAGIRTSGMGGYANTYFGHSDDKYTGSEKIKNSSSGWALSGLPLIFNGEGLSSKDYQNYMIGISIEGTTVYLTYNGSVTKLWDLYNDTIGYAKAGLDSELSADMAWGGFASNKVNIYIRGDKYNSDAISYVSIDTLSGKKTTADNVKDVEYVTTRESALPVPELAE